MVTHRGGAVVMIYTQLMERNTVSQKFDPQADLTEIRRLRRIARQKLDVAPRSRLARFRAELASLRAAGASLRELQFWLLKSHRVKVDVATILRYLRKLPEMVHGEK